jgi:Cu/Ag efflux pump CusA
MEGDEAYFARRALEERLAAVGAAVPEAQKRHYEFADRLEDLAEALRDRRA